MRSMRLPLAVLLGAALCASSVAAPAPQSSKNLYEWTAVAPIVVVGTFVEQDGRWAVFTLSKTFRGDLAQGDRVWIDLRYANNQRPSEEVALRLQAGNDYVLLIEPTDRRKPDDAERGYDLVRGVEGARALPKEGAPAVVSAIAAFVEIQDLKDFDAMWWRFRDLLDSGNPVVVETILRQHVKFRYGDPELLQRLEPLLDHPSPVIRGLAADVAGIVLGKVGGEDDEIVREVQPLLMAHARRDPSVEVRVSATRAVGAVRGPRTDALLREIADADPDQNVRYEATRLLYEHDGTGAGAPAAPGGGGD